MNPVDSAVTEPIATERLHPVRRVGSAMLGLVVVVALLAAAAVAIVPALTGARALTVLSGSMEPALPVGSVVVVRPTPAEQIAVGDVMTYTDRDTQSDATRVVTHRVTAIAPSPDGPVFTTRGDANDADDVRPTVGADVIGVQWYAIPYVGVVKEGLGTPSGLFIVAGLALALFAAHLLLPRTVQIRAVYPRRR